jgi:beta-glucanase (GH16 family)
MLKKITLLLFLFSVLSCGNAEIADSNLPNNLTVEVQADSDNPKTYTIQASAENTVEYDFRMADADEAIETNASGTFEYTFTTSGIYRIEIRAYANSGKYLKKIKEIDVPQEEVEEVNPEDGYSSPLTYEGYDLIWNDEFGGNTVNSDYWTFEIGDGCPNLCGWGNNEKQYYRAENADVADGLLTIEAREESYSGSAYTSARMITKGKFDFQYGRVDIRALLPKGQGIWPALWMLGSNITSVGWPACGELDIMEMIGGDGRDNRVHGTLHWYADGHASAGGSYQLHEGIFADEYHVFSIIWDENSVSWFVNDNKFHEIDITPSHMTEFHNKYFFIFNVAVGGNWPGSPDETTVFPQHMKVDYIRVFQEN